LRSGVMIAVHIPVITVVITLFLAAEEILDFALWNVLTHGKKPNPTIYSNNLHKIQQINIRRDKQCNVYLRKCGYTVLRFWETDVHSSPSWVGSKIMYALANSVKT